jgi:17beta-estradiol 17-dehydrogenase / very-long-chain 3-oxoacyl-CoA reductase
MPVYFAETPEDEMKDIVNINVYGTLNVTRVVLPKMIEK